MSRLVFVLGLSDDKKTQQQVEQEFTSWRSRQENGNEASGLILYLGQAAIVFLEGPTELLFKSLEVFNGMTEEVQAATSTSMPPSSIRYNAAAKSETEPPRAPRGILVNALRVLYFTELHGVRTSTGFCSFVSTVKQSGGVVQNVEDGCHEQVFMMYKKLLVASLKVKDNAGERETNPDTLQSHYRRQLDFLPVPDEVMPLLGKSAAEFFFSFTEFQKVFMKPFQLVLNSELLWPMPPALSY